MNIEQAEVPIQSNLAIRLLRVLRFNKIRYERAVSLLPDGRHAYFHALPFLLHVNHPDLPGYVDDPAVPYGLQVYSLRDSVREVLPELFPEQHELFNNFRAIWPKQRSIDALLLMGSIGSIAQSANSDFDYWVCLDTKAFSEHQLALLQTKLTRIEQWADQQGMEVHFFLSDIDHVRANDFGQADGESSGSAQARFLKAEFYATNILVAGRLPFWWLVPADADDDEYHRLLHSLKPGRSPEPHLVMDLGNLQQLDSGELFGAAIWQIAKAMDSPFKSVLKMAKLEVFLQNLGRKQPLCNLLKERVHSGFQIEGAEEQVDAYALMFDDLVDYYRRAKPDVVPLLQLCFYVKCGEPLSSYNNQLQATSTFKKRIMQSYVRHWGWDSQKLTRVDNLRQWPFHDLLVLSRQVHSFLIHCYRRLSAELSQAPQQVNPTDMTVIGRKLDSFYSRKKHKIEYLRSVMDDELYCRFVTIKADMELVSESGRRWFICSGDQLNILPETIPKKILHKGENLVEPILWSVWNKVLDGRSRFLMDYKTEPLSEADVRRMVLLFEDWFPPRKVSEISREALLAPEKITACLAVANFTSRRLRGDIDSLYVIYVTSWGELYCHRGFEIFNTLTERLDKERPRCGLMVPEGAHQERLHSDFCRRSKYEFDLL
ncbi:Adenylate cyclase [Saliniradius amylolyticus]|uniref:Adenylate cyclase n=1 Tax=Saliniradius amylolyticus TaxID=2183582 RepID=A0A2S2E2G2_9ALTE|nr:class I adenylate cyclase [Saliniradius amylolyticus]AWL11712.1 Adenylate cyclase [Saliniradius amylolyticus]